jgi:hypothetical protein
MATIYLVDNTIESIQITNITEHSILLPLARGQLFCADRANNQKECKEQWLHEEKAYWLQYEGSKKYCLAVM